MKCIECQSTMAVLLSCKNCDGILCKKCVSTNGRAWKGRRSCPNCNGRRGYSPTRNKLLDALHSALYSVTEESAYEEMWSDEDNELYSSDDESTTRTLYAIQQRKPDEDSNGYGTALAVGAGIIGGLALLGIAGAAIYSSTKDADEKKKKEGL